MARHKSRAILATTAAASMFWTIAMCLALLSVVDAGDACCKAEAARRALVPDPFAVKPAVWDDEDDGPWEAPKVKMSDLPAWYRLLHEVRIGLAGAAPWLVVGVAAAALLTTVMKPLVPSSLLRSCLGSGSNSNSNAVLDSVRGSVFGLLVPFCSCGALPLALALSQEGVSPSSIAAFVTAAQAAGVDSLFFTYGVFGARVALFRLASAGMLAFLVGMTLAVSSSEGNNKAGDKQPTSDSKNQSKASSNDGGTCCNSNKASGGCGEEPNTNSEASSPVTGAASLAMFAHTAVELFASVSVWVVLGVVVSASASVWAPASSFAPVPSDGSPGSLVQSVVVRTGLFLLTVPLTICEHGIVSLADALRGVGFSVGTAVALVVTGPSTNAGTLLLLSRLNQNKRQQQQHQQQHQQQRGGGWIADATKITVVVVVFGVCLSYLADDFGSAAAMADNLGAKQGGGGGSALPGWLNENAVSVAGVLTVLSILQSSSLLFRSPLSSSCSS